MKNKLLLKFVTGSACLLTVFLILSAKAGAATLIVDPKEGKFQPGDTFFSTIRINVNQDECINAAKVSLKYDKTRLRVLDFSKGESIFSLWVEEPKIDQEAGVISFAGGIPGGYCGRTAGDPGLTNGLGRIAFRVPSFYVGQVTSEDVSLEFLPETEVLLNDGFGTPAELKTEPAKLFVSKQPIADKPAVNEWFDAVRADNVQPEPFSVEIRRDSSIYENKFFLVFSTTDKQSGLDHYEIMEITEDGFFTRTKKQPAWHVATSPYLLQDQRLESIIKIKAIDKAGNERTIEFKAPEDLKRSQQEKIWQNRTVIAGAAVLLAIILFIFTIIFFLRRKKIKRKRKKELSTYDAENDNTPLA